MNPSLKFILIILISLEVSLIPNLLANCVILLLSIGLLVFHKIKVKTFLKLFLVPLLGAVAIFVTIYYYTPGHSLSYALILVTRLYALVFLGACLVQTTSVTNLIRSFEQNLHLPSKFAYGCLAAFNVVPKLGAEVKRIHQAALMRGIKLSFYSPQLYFKAVLSAMSWADGLTQGMLSHGYQEDAPRSVLVSIKVTKKDWLLFSGILIVMQPILFSIYLW